MAMDRRKFLAGTLAAGSASLVACAARPDTTSGPDGTAPGPTPTPAPTPTPTPTPTPGAVKVFLQSYNNDAGTALRSAPWPMYWQSAYATNDGTLVEWGTGDHNQFGDNGVREFNPLSGTQSYVFPNNNGTAFVQQYDNQQYWYIPRIDSLVIPGRGQYSRQEQRWVRGGGSLGGFWPNGPLTVGTGPNDLMRLLNTGSLYSFINLYNAHQAWSRQHDAGVFIGSSPGGDNSAQPTMYIAVPSAGIGSYAQPYVVMTRTMPATVGGVPPFCMNGRDGATFHGEHVYWVGGEATVTRSPVPNFFRMRIGPHLTSTSATLSIERLPDLPVHAGWCLLRSDPDVNALLCICGGGIFVFDVAAWAWADITPQQYRDDYAGHPANGELPQGCLGDFIDSSAGTDLQRFYWRAGLGASWEYEGSDAIVDRVHRRFRSIKLARQP